MEIAQVTPYYPPHRGGLENQVELISTELSKNHKVTVITSDVERSSEYEKVNQNLSIISLKTNFNILRNPFAFSLFFINWKKYDIVHIHDWNNLFALITILFCDKPIVISHHTNYLYFQNRIISSIYHVYAKIIGKFVLGRADKIIFSSKINYSDFQKYYFSIPSNKVNIIPSGVNSKKIKGCIKKTLNEKNYIFGFVGRMMYRKGYDIAIDAFLNFRSTEKVPNAELWLVGGPISTIYFEKTNNDKNIKWFGNVTQEELFNQIFPSFDCLLMPSRSGETFGMVIIEGLLNCNFVIANPIGGINDLFTVINSKFLIKSKADAISFAKKMVHVYNNIKSDEKEFRRIEKIIETNFNIKNNVKEIENLYSSI